MQVLLIETLRVAPGESCCQEGMATVTEALETATKHEIIPEKKRLEKLLADRESQD